MTIFRNMHGLGARFTRELATEVKARETVRQLAEQGVDAIKFVYQGNTSIPFQKLAPNVMAAIIDGNPLEDISVLHNIEVVIKGGKVVVDNR